MEADFKRDRTKNYTEFEREYLMEIVKEWPIIFSKQRDSKTLKERSAAWRAICDKYNENAEVRKRDVENLKICVMNVAAKAKKDDCAQKRSLYGTGGGPALPPINSLSATVVQMMPQTFTSLIVDDDDAVQNTSAPSTPGTSQMEFNLLYRFTFHIFHFVVIISQPKMTLPSQNHTSANMSKVKDVGQKMLELNDLRRKLIQEEHDKSMQCLEEKHEWERSKHALEMEVLTLQKTLLLHQLNQLNSYQQLPCNQPTNVHYQWSPPS
jgi:hypothetical protein